MSATSSPPSAVATNEQAPAQYIGQYEILGELASGGTGTVYLARLLGLGGLERLYAIKVLHKHLSTQPEIVEMLRKEAQLAGQVHHPHVVDMIELSVTDDGRHYLVMGYIEGASLDDLFAHPKLDAIRRVRLGIAVLLDAMSGLDAVHRATDARTGEPLGIVHRDVSPANILIGIDGIGRIADFGIASARAHSVTSEPGVVRGTPRYMPPEQATGIGPIDARSDVFGLGAVLWEVITGEPLFDSDVSVEHILQQVVSATIPPPSDRNSRMPDELDAVCLRALQRNPADRYRSVAEFRDALAKVAEHSRLIAPPRELADELSTLFAERVEQRRAIAVQAARRRSGTQLRAVIVCDDRAPNERDPLRESITRSSLTATRIGLSPAPPPPPPVKPPAPAAPPAAAGIADIRATLDDLLGHDEEDDDKVDFADEPTIVQHLTIPTHRWQPWAVLAGALLATGVSVGYVVHHAATGPKVDEVVATPIVTQAKLVTHAKPPAPVPAPAPVAPAAEPPLQPIIADAYEPPPLLAAPPTIAKLKRTAPKLAPKLVPRRAALKLDEPAEPIATLPLETNPYRLSH